ncbi:BICD family-like cargo adapter 2 isoform X1 [Periophthalmus magnuspinnatus]|uniref:BICD family-like cargo adapter 2 n=1 Tax=Periophthalmus magnuspinnatus TaxID=409849 RepID=A0A3B3ZMX3_9GOBI|nr:BICD family-like cargo adapter 2 isoform X1 [Periophthalmus magnuspinnatus]XP_055082700.1 BICD family-like cargo adapter 2 isoform X1 [Periophthalmus magnuspinnatus]
MFTSRKNSLPSPSLEDSFFPLSASSSISLSFALPSSSSPNGSVDSGAGIETDLILAAELGQALLEKNEELSAALEQREKEFEALQQEKHILQRKLEMNELTSSQKEAELTADLASLKAELERYQSSGRDRRRDESEQLTQLANHNQRLVEQLAEAVTLEHSLRTELRSLREEMEESSFSRNISFSQLENIQAENRVLSERLSHMEMQLKASEEDTERLRVEREALREQVSDLQVKLREREAEIEQEQGMIFELRTMNRSLQQKTLGMGEESVLDSTHLQPLSLLSEIQQSQAKEVLLAHSEVLQTRDQEIQTLKEELKAKQEELDSLQQEIEQFRSSPGKPSYSSLESELATVRQEKESLTNQLLDTIKHKVVLSQELEAWQEDMRLVINQQVQQREEERQKEQEKLASPAAAGLQRSKSLRLRGEGGKGFFSSLFRDK